MNVARLMVLRIRDEEDIAETKRCHVPQHNLSGLDYQAALTMDCSVAN